MNAWRMHHRSLRFVSTLVELRLSQRAQPLLEDVPSSGLGDSAYGARLSAIIVLLTGVYHLSRRLTQRVARELLGVKLSSAPSAISSAGLRTRSKRPPRRLGTGFNRRRLPEP